VADETEKITYEIIVDDSKATGKTKDVADSFKKVGDSSKAAKESISGLSDGINKMVPGLGGAVSGFQGMATAAKAFIATPIGLVVAALGTAIGALTAYFKGSEEGQNKLNKILQIGATIFEKLTDIVEEFGGALFNGVGKAIDFVVGGLDKLATAVGINTSGIKNFFNEIDKEAEKFAANDRKRNEQERELIILRGRTQRQIADLIIEAQEAEGQSKLDAINKAIKLQDELSKKEIEYAKTILERAKLEEGRDSTTENKKKLAEAVAGLEQAEASYNESIKRFNKQRIQIEDELAGVLQKNAEAEEKIRIKNLENIEKENAALAKGILESADRSIKRQEEQDAIHVQTLATMQAEQDAERAASDASFADYKKKEEDKNKVKKDSAKMSEDLARTGIALLGAATGEAKVVALANVAYDTGKAIAGLTANSETNPANAFTFGAAGALQFALGIVRILGNIATATQIINKHERGGVLRGPSHANGGIPFSVGGRLGFEAEGGEAIINKRSTSMFRSQLSAINAAGGGVRFADGGIAPFATASIANQLNYESIFQRMTDVFQNTSQKVLVIEDFEQLQTQRDQTNARATV